MLFYRRCGKNYRQRCPHLLLQDSRPPMLLHHLHSQGMQQTRCGIDWTGLPAQSHGALKWQGPRQLSQRFRLLSQLHHIRCAAGHPHATLTMAQAELQHLFLVGAPTVQHLLGIKRHLVCRLFRLLRCSNQCIDRRGVYQHKANLRIKLQPKIQQPSAASIGPPPNWLLPIGQENVASGLFPRLARLHGFHRPRPMGK